MKRIICKTLIFVFLLLFTILPLSVYAEEGLVYWVNQMVAGITIWIRTARQ